MSCPNCGSSNLSHYNKTERNIDKSLPDVHFIDIVIRCDECGYSSNCVCAKSLNTTK